MLIAGKAGVGRPDDGKDMLVGIMNDIYRHILLKGDQETAKRWQ